MKLKDISRRDIVKMALEALPRCEEGNVVVVVDVRDGSVEVLTKSKQFENWAKNFKNIKAILCMEEKEANKDIDILYRKYKHEVCCAILELKEEFPHLK